MKPLLRALRLLFTGALVTGSFMAPSPAAAATECGVAGDPCETGQGSYYVAAPDGPGPFPVVLFLHGAGGSGQAVVENAGFARGLTRRGYVLLAPTAELKVYGERRFTNWNVRDGRKGFARDLSLLRAVLKHAAARLSLDLDQVLLAGFSRGGSLVWDVACAHPKEFTAFAPVAGGFWEPMARDCAGPVRMLHTHGWTDRIVPLEGRMLRGGALRQGDIFKGLTRWRAENGCANHRADAFVTKGRFLRRKWLECAPGTALELALHTGGHSTPVGWSAMALDWFEALSAEAAQ